MSLFGHEYKVHTQTEIGMCLTPNQVGNSLNGAVLQAHTFKGTDINYVLRDKAANSLAGALYRTSKKCQKGGKYADTIGTPTGTLILRPITKDVMFSVLGFEPDKILLTKVQKADEYLYACYIYDTLVSDYAFEGDLEANTGQVKIEGKYYTYEGVHPSYYEFSHELNGYYWEYSEKAIRYTMQGPTETVVRHRVPIDLDLQPNVDYLVVKYEYEDTVHYYLWNTTDNVPALNKWHQENQVAYYPSFYMRDRNDSIKRSDSDYYKQVCKILQRANIDFEDLVDSYNGEAKLNKEEEEDKDYKNSLNNIEEIVLTFAVDPTANDQRVMQYLFEFFSIMNNGINGSQIDYNCKGFSYTLRWNSINKEVKSGRIAPFHRYISETTQISIPVEIRTGANTTVTTYSSKQALRIAHQLTSTTYEEITVTDLQWSTNNNGNTDTYGLPEFHNYNRKKPKEYSAEEESEMQSESSKVLVPLVPWIVHEKFGAIRGGDLLSLGMAYVMHVYKKTKKKWYATKWFSIVRIVVSVCIIVASCGFASGEVLAINAIIEASLQVLITVLIMLAVKIALKILVKVLHIQSTFIDGFFAVYDFIGTLYSPVYALGNAAVNLATEVITTGKISANTLIDSLCSVAGTQLMMMGPLGAIAGVAYKLGSNPSFYAAIDTKNYAGAAIMAASVIAEAVAIQFSSGTNESKSGENNSNSSDSSANTNNSKSGNADSTSSSKEPSFADKLKFHSFEGIGTVASAVMNSKAQRKQEQLSFLRSKATTLAGQMQASENYWAEVLSSNNVIMQQLIIENIQRPDYIKPVTFRHINDYAGEYGVLI